MIISAHTDFLTLLTDFHNNCTYSCYWLSISDLSFHCNADDLLGKSYNKHATVQAMSAVQYDRTVQYFKKITVYNISHCIKF